MSSRALRKLQRNDLENLDIPESGSDEEADVQTQNRKNKKKKKPAVENLFELVLNFRCIYIHSLIIGNSFYFRFS